MRGFRACSDCLVHAYMHACACTHAYAGMGVQCKKDKGFGCAKWLRVLVWLGFPDVRVLKCRCSPGSGDVRRVKGRCSPGFRYEVGLSCSSSADFAR